MPTRETYLLHLYRSRAVSGWQWAARLEHLPDGDSQRFRDPEALLAHLRTVVGLGLGPEEQAPRPGAASQGDVGEGATSQAQGTSANRYVDGLP